MIRIAIVDDEIGYIMQLKDYLKRYSEEVGVVFDISVFADGDSIAHKYNAEYDIILMDIAMKLMDGMSAAEEIRKSDMDVTIIFITNMAQYAIRGYAVEALDYVLKPISYFAFSQVLTKALNKRKKAETSAMTINVRGGSVRLNISQIYYIESQGHSLIYHTVSGAYETSGTMKEVEGRLSGHGFFRGNKGYLINLAYVDGMVNGEALVKGSRLIISRGNKSKFMEALAEFWK